MDERRIKTRFLKTGERPDYVVCGSKSYFQDDKDALCLHCKAKIYFRPHSPIPNVGYLCGTCAMIDMEKQERPEISSTPQAIGEARSKIKQMGRDPDNSAGLGGRILKP